ncbi:hypothetical protein [Methanobacterium formicicum]|uniref:Uncharacterized protein n=1 Tax=Methanobacterium formicicum (strain DSM 3637 / PP1) TaxID=1204725 RepID=K2QCY8_METFP|nr:hypothetical protein [Methanobacterium formicicum]EKF85856.1 hypothetical protein A994_07240 [Methanobacterium formicicum DSM 3637]
MLARKMKLMLNGDEICSTPLLIKSFSSRINLDICGIIEILGEYISGPILISAYDLHYTKEFPSLEFADILFIDSGGYECSLDDLISEIGYYRPESYDWNKNLHLTSLNKWDNGVPTAVISYDHPSKREKIEEQIENAKKLFDGRDDILKELLIKAEDKNAIIDIDNIIKNMEAISYFDILGFTEKELGNSIIERMVTIAKLRKEMDKNGIEIPIHIFGSLDTITTPLYYFSGADIFDSLSWLRFTFYEGGTFYPEGISSQIHGIRKNTSIINILNIIQNYKYLIEFKRDLEMFQNTGDFAIFKNNSEFFENAYNELQKELGE